MCITNLLWKLRIYILVVWKILCYISFRFWFNGKKKYIHSMNKYKGKNGFGDRLNYMRLRSDFFFCVWIVHKINVWKKYFMLKLVFYLISFVELISCQNEVFDPFKCSQSLITTKCGAQGNWWKFKSSSLQRTA